MFVFGVENKFKKREKISKNYPKNLQNQNRMK